MKEIVNYPLPTFHFRVVWAPGTNMGFSEVTGLNIENQVIEYRDGASFEFSMRKFAGLRKNGNITMKRGIMKADNQYYEWLDSIKINTTEGRRDIMISLLDEEHN